MNSKPYRKNAGAIVFNSLSRVLVGERHDYPGQWQLPQGGIDKGEMPLDAARRELEEETSLCLEDKPVFEIPEWLNYEFPKDIPKGLAAYRGQTQKWFFFFWDGDITTLNHKNVDNPEFHSLQWRTPQELVQQIVSFKKKTYEILEQKGREVISKYLLTLGRQ